MKAATALTLCLMCLGIASGAQDKGKPKRAARQAVADVAAPVSFINDVMPLLDSRGCNSTQCHGASKGQGELKLSLFGAEPDKDYVALTKESEGRRINPVEPLKSLLLLKATGAIEHSGKQRIKPDGADYRTLARWLGAGAPKDAPGGRTIASLQVVPAEVRLEKGKAQDFSVTALFSDGSRQDVTRNARFATTEPRVATVKRTGVQAAGYGQAYVVVTYNRRSTVARIAVRQPLPEAFPKAESFNGIDDRVLAKLRELGIPPSDLCTDQEFLRRVSLDVIGTLPTPDEIRTFLADKDPQKRSKLIDRLMQRTEFADFWSLKWGDLLRIKAEFPSNLWPNAVQAYYHWVWQSISENKPYDQFVRELLLAKGDNFRDPPANYYRAMEKRDPQGFAESTALLFMGARLDCARCHGHPTESWTLDDNLGLAAFFPQIKFKGTKEWKEEIVYLDSTAVLRHPRTKAEILPRLPGGEPLVLEPGSDPRVKLVDWLTAPDNPWFAKAIVNRMWFWLLGRGIVHEPDDIRPTNPPCNPELLAFLEKELVTHGYDVRHLFRLILNSATYQRSSVPNRWNADDAALFSHYPLKRLPAEEMTDAIGQFTLIWDNFASQIPEPYSKWPSGFRAIQMADGSVGTATLELFGRPPRDTSYESDRDCRTSMRQALFFVTSTELQNKLVRSPRVRPWMKEKDDKVVEEMFLLSLSRFPTDAEKKKAMAHLAEDPKKRALAIQDLMWALLNTKEFMFNH